DRRRANRQSRRDDRRRDHRADVQRPRRAPDHSGAGHARHRPCRALRPRRAPALGPHRANRRTHRGAGMSTTTLTSSVLPLRLAFRELRAGLRGFYVFIACIALGVLAIAAVGSLSASLENGLAREGRTILGGDLSFLLSHREVSAPE